MSMTLRQNGFTFIEIAITVAIVALLATLVVPMGELMVKRDKEQGLRLALREIRMAVDAYKRAVDEGRIASDMGKSGYPPQLKVLVDGVADLKSPDANRKIYFLRRIPRDPMESDQAKNNEETWGKRSYESDPNDPAEGEDVFDVYSKSADVGINGVPYRDW